MRLFRALIVVCIQTVACVDSDSDDSVTTAATSVLQTLSKCWVIYEGVKVMTCKLCGHKSNAEVPFDVPESYDASADLSHRRRPWLMTGHVLGAKGPRGVCAFRAGVCSSNQGSSTNMTASR